MDIVFGPQYRRTADILRAQAALMPGLENVTLCWGARPAVHPNGVVVSNDGPWYDKLEQYGRIADIDIPNYCVRAPIYTIDRGTALDWLRRNPYSWRDVWGRKADGSRGKGIYVPLSHSSPGRKWMESDYWVWKVEAPYEEYRFHVFDGRSIMRSMKVRTGENWRRADVRNHGNGWTFRRDCPDIPGAREAAKAAVAAMGYTWGAVDMIIKRAEDEGHLFFILEVNRFPGVDNRTAAAYCQAIERYVTEVE